MITINEHEVIESETVEQLNYQTDECLVCSLCGHYACDEGDICQA